MNDEDRFKFHDIRVAADCQTIGGVGAVFSAPFFRPRYMVTIAPQIARCGVSCHTACRIYGGAFEQTNVPAHVVRLAKCFKMAETLKIGQSLWRSLPIKWNVRIRPRGAVARCAARRAVAVRPLVIRSLGARRRTVNGRSVAFL